MLRDANVLVSKEADQNQTPGEEESEQPSVDPID